MLRLLSGLLLTLTAPIAALLALAPSVTAEEDTATVWIRTTTLDSFAITDACYTILDASVEGCDENGDGYIRFADIAPGSYTVSQSTGVDGYLPVGDFPIEVQPYTPEQYAEVMMVSSAVEPGTTVDIAIRAADPLTGRAEPGSCMILHGGSIEGCDENGDGEIAFAGVPVGTYLLQETVPPDGAIPLGGRWIAVDTSGTITVLRQQTGANPNAGTADVAIVTRDPVTGDPLPGACYIVEDASIEGCDENGDGEVNFADVPVGIFVLHQTQPPTGHATIEDVRIDIAPLASEQSIVVKQARQQHDAGHRHVSLVFYDTSSAQAVPGRICVELVGASIEGCDENGDGQIDFLDVPVGSFPIAFTQLPAGYAPAYASYTLANSPENPFSITVFHIGLSRTR